MEDLYTLYTLKNTTEHIVHYYMIIYYRATFLFPNVSSRTSASINFYDHRHGHQLAQHTLKFVMLNFRSVVDNTIIILLLTVRFIGYSTRRFFANKTIFYNIENIACFYYFITKQIIDRNSKDIS